VFLGWAKQALYLSHTKTNTNGTKPAIMMMTHAPASGLLPESGASSYVAGFVQLLAYAIEPFGLVEGYGVGFDGGCKG
jgi:hypothetical protein